MIRKFVIVLVPFLLCSMQSKAQSVQVELNYQSFLPFIHLQLRFGNHRHHYPRAYRRAYLRGYMDGVNDHYYYRRHYRRMEHRLIRAYKTGYHDGFKDRGLMIRLRGHDWLRRYCFNRRDYDSPSISVRVWLSRLSHAFSSVRVPPGWRHRNHHRRGRGWYKHRYRRHRHHRHHYYRGDDDWEDFYEESHEDFDEDDD